MKSNMQNPTLPIVTYRSDLTDKPAQVKLLNELITSNETGSKHFTVFAMEAGGGKSKETNRIIFEYIRSGGTRKFLIVKKFDDDVLDCATAINDGSGSSDVALGIIAETWKVLKHNASILRNYQVLVITHKRYADLSADSVARAYFEYERHTLVVDEHIDAPICSFSDKVRSDAMQVISRLPFEVLDLANSLCRRPMELLKRHEKDNNYVVRLRSCVDAKALDQFISILSNHWMKLKNLDKNGSVKKLTNALYSMTNDYALYCGNQISALDPRINRWTLQNNLLLDANGSMDKRYAYASDIDKIIVPARTLDYRETTVHPIIFNTSKSNIKHSANYVSVVCSKIAQNLNGKVLIVTDKELEPSFAKELKRIVGVDANVGDDHNGEYIAITHFGDFLGKNKWQEFNQVWIVSSNLWHGETYVLSSDFYTLQEGGYEKVSMNGRSGKGYGFTDENLEQVRRGIIICNFYQAAKRVNRFEQPRKADIFIIYPDVTLIEEVCAQFLNAKLAKPQTLDEVKSKKKQASTDVKPINVDKLCALIGKLGPGTYAKSDLCSQIGISDSNWSRDLKKAMEKLKHLYVINKLRGGREIEVIEL